MDKKGAIETIEGGLNELKEIIKKEITFNAEEFSSLVRCLECLDQHVVGKIGEKGLLDLGFNR